MHFIVAKELNSYMLLTQAGDSFADILRVVSVVWLQDELGSCLS